MSGAATSIVSPADLEKYNNLLVDRTKIWFKGYESIDSDGLKMLTDHLYEAIERAVGDAYPIVAEPARMYCASALP